MYKRTILDIYYPILPLEATCQLFHAAGTMGGMK